MDTSLRQTAVDGQSEARLPYIRLAQQYAKLSLSVAEAAYGLDIQRVLEPFRGKRPQLDICWSWASRRIESDPEAAELCVSFLKGGVALLMMHDTQTLMAWCDRVLDVSRIYSNPTAEVIALAQKGAAYLQNGQYADAEMCTARVLELLGGIAETTPPDASLLSDGAQILNNLALALQYQNRYEEALQLQQDSLTISRRLFPEDHPFVAEKEANLALMYAETGGYDDAIRLLNKSLNKLDRSLPPGDRRIAQVLHNLSLAYQRRGGITDIAKALPFTLRALEIRANLGPSDPDFAQSLSAAGDMFLHSGRLQEAGSCLLRALAIYREARVPDEHQSVLRAKNCLGHVYMNCQHYPEAQELLHEVLARRRETLGPNHRQVAESLLSVAELHGRQGSRQLAMENLLGAVSIATSQLGVDHPDTKIMMHKLQSAQNNNRWMERPASERLGGVVGAVTTKASLRVLRFFRRFS